MAEEEVAAVVAAVAVEVAAVVTRARGMYLQQKIFSISQMLKILCKHSYLTSEKVSIQ